MRRGIAGDIACKSWQENPTLECGTTPFQRWYLIARQIVKLADDLRNSANDIRAGAFEDTSVLIGDIILDSDDDDDNYYEEMYTVNITEARNLLNSLIDVKSRLDAALLMLANEKLAAQNSENVTKEPIQ